MINMFDVFLLLIFLRVVIVTSGISSFIFLKRYVDRKRLELIKAKQRERMLGASKESKGEWEVGRDSSSMPKKYRVEKIGMISAKAHFMGFSKSKSSLHSVHYSRIKGLNLITLKIRVLILPFSCYTFSCKLVKRIWC